VITLAEVIEQCAREAEAFEPRYDDNRIAEAIRALIPKYEGCIVAQGAPEVWRYQLLAEDQVVNELFACINWDVRYKPFGRYDVDHGGTATKTPLYRAKEPTK
jgi:hypothetical protein